MHFLKNEDMEPSNKEKKTQNLITTDKRAPWVGGVKEEKGKV